MNICVFPNAGRAGKCLVIALLAFAMRVDASVGLSLTDGNSTAYYDPFSPAGVYQWDVDAASVLKKQWFWYRIGNGAEQSIDSIASAGSVSVTPLNPSSASLVYTMPGQFSIEMTLLLTGGSVGSGASDLTEQVKIKNLSGSTLDFHVFQYADFDLGAVDSVSLGQNLLGKFNRATQTNGAALQETIVTPASRAEVATVPLTLNSLNDGAATTLTSPLVAVGDVSWAFQWDYTIAAGNTSPTIGIDKRLVVPEPSTAVVAGLGLTLLLVSVRRRQQ
jgi:hypothetical protein